MLTTTDSPDARLPDKLIDQATLLLVSGQQPERVETWLIGQTGDSVLASRVVAAARQKITVAADYARDEKLGIAVRRLEDLFSKAMAEKPSDLKTALAAQRELNRLLRLHENGGDSSGGTSPGADQDEEAGRVLAQVASYLVPLNLVDPDYPITEHARVAANTIREAGLAKL